MRWQPILGQGLAAVRSNRCSMSPAPGTLPVPPPPPPPPPPHTHPHTHTHTHPPPPPSQAMASCRQPLSGPGAPEHRSGRTRAARAAGRRPGGRQTPGWTRRSASGRSCGPAGRTGTPTCGRWVDGGGLRQASSKQADAAAPVRVNPQQRYRPATPICLLGAHSARPPGARQQRPKAGRVQSHLNVLVAAAGLHAAAQDAAATLDVRRRRQVVGQAQGRLEVLNQHLKQRRQGCTACHSPRGWVPRFGGSAGGLRAHEWGHG